MNYEAEQQAELEVLQAIYENDMKILDTRPTKLQIPVVPEGSDIATSSTMVNLIVTFTPKYPEVVPNINVQPVKGVTKKQTENLDAILKIFASENLGEPMVYNLTNRSVEWLTEGSYDEVATTEKKIKVVAAVTHGTMTTKENFIAWKKKFDAENIHQIRVKKVVEGLTGKQWFMKMNSTIDWELFNPDEEFMDDDFIDEDLEAEEDDDVDDSPLPDAEAIEEYLFD